MKHKVFVLINVLGLGTALACCIVAYLNWEYNEQFDAYHENTENVYRVNFVRITNGQPIKNGSAPQPLGDAIETAIPQVDAVMRYLNVNGNFKIKNEVFRTGVAAVDPTFFELFTFPILQGRPLDSLDKKSIVISRTLQEKHFPNIPNPIGETITLINGEEQTDFNLSGVFEDPPKNTSFYAEAYILYDNAFDIMGWTRNNWAAFNTTFVKVPNPADIPSVETQLKN